jgi:hypothetical protein
VYRNEADALAAKERLKNQPGFREYPDGFITAKYDIGRDHWTEGLALRGNTQIELIGHI